MTEEQLIPKKFLEIILRERCNIFANPQCGKTNLSKVIVSEYVRQGIPIKIKIFDTAQVWRHEFLSSFNVQEISNHTGELVAQLKNVIYDVEFNESERIMEFVGNEVLMDYNRNRELKKNGDVEHILYVIEEAQNSLGRYSLTRKSGAFWLKAISEGANFGLSYLFIGQRAADVSTSVIERSTVSFIGKTTGDNNSRKLKALIGNANNYMGQPIYEVAKTLKVGDFIFWDGDEAWLFKVPLFNDLYPNQRPTLIEPRSQRWEKIF